MIAETFLACALALPPVSFTKDSIKSGEVLFIRGITNERYEKDNDPYVILMGVPSSWVREFSILFKAYRIESNYPKTEYDIMASTVRLPIKSDSVRVIIYGYGEGYSLWGTMRSLTEAIWPIEPHGIFLYYASKCPRFAEYLYGFGFRKIDMMWRTFDIWEKIPKHNRTFSVMKSV